MADKSNGVDTTMPDIAPQSDGRSANRTHKSTEVHLTAVPMRDGLEGDHIELPKPSGHKTQSNDQRPDVANEKLTRVRSLIEEANMRLEPTVENLIKAGGLLIGAKELAVHGNWRGEFEKHFDDGLRKAQILMKIASNVALTKTQHVAHLPPRWGTLGILAVLPSKFIEAEIATKHIHPQMTRNEAISLADSHKEQSADKRKNSNTRPKTKTAAATNKSAFKIKAREDKGNGSSIKADDPSNKEETTSEVSASPVDEMIASYDELDANFRALSEDDHDLFLSELADSKERFAKVSLASHLADAFDEDEEVTTATASSVTK